MLLSNWLKRPCRNYGSLPRHVTASPFCRLPVRCHGRSSDVRHLGSELVSR